MAYDVQNEVWGEFAGGAFFILLRFYARYKTMGVQNFGIDDVFAFFALLFYAAYTIMGNLVSTLGSGIGLTPEYALSLADDSDELKQRIVGAKVLFAAWPMYICLVWCLKGIMLTLYTRMASGLPREALFVRISTIFVGLSWVVCLLGHFCQCMPFSHNWQIKPFPGEACTTRNLNYWIIGILNILTDFTIVILPLPILAQSNLSRLRKLLLAGLLCSGIFIIICSILRTYYSLRDISLLETALGWAGRETMVASIAVCAPAIKPLFNHISWLRGSSFNSSQRNGAAGRKKGTSGANGNGGSNYIDMDHQLVTIGGSGAARSKGSRNQPGSVWQITRGDSEENIVRNSDEHAKGANGIHVRTDFTVDAAGSDTGSIEKENGKKGVVFA
jgi:hypothetical protein